MNILFIITVLIIGASGIIAQVLILRELQVSFYGNELTVGIILANWILIEALGACLLGRTAASRSIRDSAAVFLLLEILQLLDVS